MPLPLFDMRRWKKAPTGGSTVVPNRAGAVGGANVTISGTGLENAIAVEFRSGSNSQWGTITSTGLGVCNVNVPSYAPDTVNGTGATAVTVYVYTPSGVSSDGGNFYYYPGAPAVSWMPDVFSSITFNGSQIYAIADQSGNGNSGIQATPANQPTYSATAINGHPGMSVNLVHGLQLTSGGWNPTACSVFTCAIDTGSPANTTVRQIIDNVGAGSLRMSLRIDNGTAGLLQTFVPAGASGLSGQSFTTAKMYGAGMSGAGNSCLTSLNTTRLTFAVTNPASMSGITWGTGPGLSFGWLGNISEFLGYTTHFNDATRIGNIYAIWQKVWGI